MLREYTCVLSHKDSFMAMVFAHELLSFVILHKPEQKHIYDDMYCISKEFSSRGSTFH